MLPGTAPVSVNASLPSLCHSSVMASADGKCDDMPWKGETGKYSHDDPGAPVIYARWRFHGEFTSRPAGLLHGLHRSVSVCVSGIDFCAECPGNMVHPTGTDCQCQSVAITYPLYPATELHHRVITRSFCPAPSKPVAWKRPNLTPAFISSIAPAKAGSLLFTRVRAA